jgi:hypothetical protein
MPYMADGSGLNQFLHAGRLQLTFSGKTLVRSVYQAGLIRASEASTLEAYLADRVPYYYREPSEIAADFGEGYFISAIKDTLRRLPTADNFKESHFGEILAAVYAEEVLGLRRLYSKLALSTSENQNAFKMDVLMYAPGTDPVEFVFAEVKSSMKTATDGMPAGHDNVCFAKLFESFNAYKDADLDFDIALIKERMAELSDEDAALISEALKPHRNRLIRYAGFCVIDTTTYAEDEAALLGTRKNDKTFDVDLLCVADLPEVVQQVYGQLERLRTS